MRRPVPANMPRPNSSRFVLDNFPAHQSRVHTIGRGADPPGFRRMGAHAIGNQAQPRRAARLCSKLQAAPLAQGQGLGDFKDHKGQAAVFQRLLGHRQTVGFRGGIGQQHPRRRAEPRDTIGKYVFARPTGAPPQARSGPVRQLRQRKGHAPRPAGLMHTRRPQTGHKVVGREVSHPVRIAWKETGTNQKHACLTTGFQRPVRLPEQSACQSKMGKPVMGRFFHGCRPVQSLQLHLSENARASPACGCRRRARGAGAVQSAASAQNGKVKAHLDPQPVIADIELQAAPVQRNDVLHKGKAQPVAFGTR